MSFPFWVNELPGVATSDALVTLSRLLRQPDVTHADERWTDVLLSSYAIDFAWLFATLPWLLELSGSLVVLSGTRGSAASSLLPGSGAALARQCGPSHMERVRELVSAGRLSVLEPPLPLPWGVHHSKFIVALNGRGARVVVTTANLLRDDWELKAQGVYTQDFPKVVGPSPVRGRTVPTDASAAPCFHDKAASFREEWRTYLRACGVLGNSSTISGAGASMSLPRAFPAQTFLEQHDFSAAKVFLVTSVPGRHHGARHGMWRLAHLTETLGLRKPHDSPPTLCWQYSSQGRLTEPFLSELRRACAGGGQHPDAEVQVVYPTEEEVRMSLEGWRGGLSLPVRLASWSEFVNSRLYRWGGRRGEHEPFRPFSLAVPHIKSYSARNAATGRLRWLLVTSANLSHAAHGVPERTKDGARVLRISSYEMGVFYDASSAWNGEDIFSATPSAAVGRAETSEERSGGTSSASSPCPLPFALPTAANLGGDLLFPVSFDDAGPTLFLPYALRDPQPYASTEQLRRGVAPGALNTADTPWVVDLPHKGRDANGATFDETIGAAATGANLHSVSRVIGGKRQRDSD